jgi:hypothetical protein
MTSASVNTMVNETLAYPFPGSHSRHRSRENRDWLNASVLTPICSRGRPDADPYGNLIVKDSARGFCGKIPKALTESISRRWKIDAKEAGY